MRLTPLYSFLSQTTLQEIWSVTSLTLLNVIMNLITLVNTSVTAGHALLNLMKRQADAVASTILQPTNMIDVPRVGMPP